jgi:hypothetical protein
MATISTAAAQMMAEVAISLAGGKRLSDGGKAQKLLEDGRNPQLQGNRQHLHPLPAGVWLG